MRVLAARFPDREHASAALDALRRRFALRADDAAIAPLGIPGLADEGSDTLLAGRFRENNLDVVRRTLTKAGGSVVADVDEQWTRPRPTRTKRRNTTKRDRARGGVVPF